MPVAANMPRNKEWRKRSFLLLQTGNTVVQRAALLHYQMNPFAELTMQEK
ncbi:TPA: hypothetical protein OT171_003874 [Citrobacter sedlakii]|nr:hypothetical protein [Citrobacter sedlakii]